MGRTPLSICAVVVAMGLLAGAPPPNQGAAEQHSQAEQSEQQTGPPVATPEAQKADALYVACKKGEANRNSDLCAQWYAADSAYEASIWSRRTGWFTGLGLIVGAITMGAAIAAALFAKYAADHTRASVEQSIKEYEESLEANDRENRPSVLVADAAYRHLPDGSGQIILTIENVGRQAAVDVYVLSRQRFHMPEAQYYEERSSVGSALRWLPKLTKGNKHRIGAVGPTPADCSFPSVRSGRTNCGTAICARGPSFTAT